MKTFLFALSLLLVVGCATTGRKPIVWETSDIPRSHEVLGPVSVREEIVETDEEMIQGFAQFVSQDGRLSDRLPPELEAVLKARREKYRDMIFERLATKAKTYDADAVIGTDYSYIPPYVSFSKKAIITANGTMVKYK